MYMYAILKRCSSFQLENAIYLAVIFLPHLCNVILSVVCVSSAMACAASALLPRSLSEGCAHTLAAIHLQLRSRVGLLPTYNCTFQYLVERSVCAISESTVVLSI